MSLLLFVYFPIVQTNLTDVHVKRHAGVIYCSFVRPLSMTLLDQGNGIHRTFDLSVNYYIFLAWGDLIQGEAWYCDLYFTSGSSDCLRTIDSIHGQRNPHRERGLAGMGNGCFAEFCCCVPLCPCELRYSSSKDISFHRFPGDKVAGRECIFKSRRDMPLLWKICR